jgi:PAB-dependent poly(A)-specific ribonuclease subunit 3
LAIQRENLQTSMEIVTSTYSSDLRNFIMYLLTNPTRIKSINDLMPMIGRLERFLKLEENLFSFLNALG